MVLGCEMAQIKDDMIPFIKANEINRIIEKLAWEIEGDYEGAELAVICPLKGSLMFCADLTRKIKRPQVIDFVHLFSVRGSNIRILKDISLDITNKHVLIVEGIIDAGRTLNFLRTRLLASHPASLKIATLLDKPARRELPIKADYIGKTIEDRFVVGYGLDSDEFGRNYKDIYNLAQ